MTATITPATRMNSALALAESFDNSTNPTYMFCGKIESWDNEIHPDLVNSNLEESEIYKNDLIFIKKINSQDCNLVIRRHEYLHDRLVDPESEDYVLPMVYTQWRSDVDITDHREWLSQSQPFYVYAPEDNGSGDTNHNVYMCISNGGGVVSEHRPSGQALDVFYTADGYKWKFMFDIPEPLAERHLNASWIPVPYRTSGEMGKTSKHIATENYVTHGTIDNIIVVSVGENYNAEDTVVTIGGDGEGAVAEVVLDLSGGISSIVVTSPGTNYTYANVIISGATGTGAIGKPMISPIKGHGSNSQVQLGAYYLSIRGGFVNTEDGIFPAQNSYRKVGLIKNVKKTDGDLFIGDSANYFHELKVVNITQQFPYSQEIQGIQSSGSAYVFNQHPLGEPPEGTLYILKKNGSFIDNETVKLVDGDPTATVSEFIPCEIDTFSGDLLYMENILSVARHLSQSEIFTFVLEY